MDNVTTKDTKMRSGLVAIFITWLLLLFVQLRGFEIVIICLAVYLINEYLLGSKKEKIKFVSSKYLLKSTGFVLLIIVAGTIASSLVDWWLESNERADKCSEDISYIPNDNS